jgi:rhamnosyltransferase
MKSTSDCTVSILMRSMNEMPHPPRVLEALARQTIQIFTLYNVDSGSTDGTVEVFEKANPNRLRKIAPADYIPGRVLNEMVAAAPEDITVFLNADAVPTDEHWLENLLRPILDGQADATMSKQIARPDAFWIVGDDYVRAYDPRNIKEENEDFFSAVSCAFKRSLWEETKFYEEGYAEDLVWAAACRRKGARFRLVLNSVVEHSHNYSLPSLHKKKYRHGIVFARLYGQKPRLLSRLAACTKEIVRDTLRAIASGRIRTLPYNLRYRTNIHAAFHQGLKAGQGQPSLP